MSHTVAVGEFEGPLGILLDLVERKKLEVTSISVAEITTGYLERIRDMKEHSPEDLSEFLALGARLLYVKSLALLPPGAEGTDEQAEELRRLGLELEEYRRIKTAARALGARADVHTWTRLITEQLPPGELPVPDVKLPALAEAFTRALGRLPEPPPTAVLRQSVDPAAVMAGLRRRVRSGFALEAVLQACRSRLEVIVTFICLLELMREGNAKAVQPSQFEDIMVEPI
jgi:segregation and condensation protein A